MWDDIVAWFQSSGGARVLQTAIIPALAILVAGLLAAAIARSAVRATIRRAERQEATSVVAGLVAAARLSAEAGADAGAPRRAARLRAEADVRVRLLTLPGSELAADWSAGRIDAIALHASDGSVTAELNELRDRLIQWVNAPSRARRVFVAPVAGRTASQVATPAAVTPEPPAEVGSPAPDAEQPSVEPREQERPALPAAVPGPRRTPPAADPEATVVPAALPAEPEPELVAATAAAPALSENLPAWQRTRAGERLQQERTRGRAVEAPTTDDEDTTAFSTAPVAFSHPHRADEAAAAAAAAAAEAEEAVRLEAHQQARHARPTDPSAAATSSTPAVTPAPAWLDAYDDEAQVTQNLDLKTPPPVAASAVRDRGAPGDDLVPRS